MDRQSRSLQDWRRYHFEVERDYARRIVLSPKGSEERSQLLEEAYSRVIGDIIEQYDPKGGETLYTDVLVSIVRGLVERGGRVFDLGCGSGNLVAALIQCGYEARGIDLSGDCIQRAKKKLGPLAGDRSVERADILDYQTAEVFDCVVMDNVIEHIAPDSVEYVLVKCHRMLSRQGYVVIWTPHRFSGPHDISKYFRPLGARAEGFHLREYSFTDLQEELRKAGFQRVLGFPFHPRLLRRFGVVPRPSLWAAWKAKLLERCLEDSPLSRILTLNRTLSHALVAVFFPAVCVGVKGTC